MLFLCFKNTGIHAHTHIYSFVSIISIQNDTKNYCVAHVLIHAKNAFMKYFNNKLFVLIF